MEENYWNSSLSSAWDSSTPFGQTQSDEDRQYQRLNVNLPFNLASRGNNGALTSSVGNRSGGLQSSNQVIGQSITNVEEVYGEDADHPEYILENCIESRDWKYLLHADRSYRVKPDPNRLRANMFEVSGVSKEKRMQEDADALQFYQGLYDDFVAQNHQHSHFAKVLLHPRNASRIHREIEMGLQKRIGIAAHIKPDEQLHKILMNHAYRTKTWPPVVGNLMKVNQDIVEEAIEGYVSAHFQQSFHRKHHLEGFRQMPVDWGAKETAFTNDEEDDEQVGYQPSVSDYHTMNPYGKKYDEFLETQGIVRPAGCADKKFVIPNDPADRKRGDRNAFDFSFGNRS